MQNSFCEGTIVQIAANTNVTVDDILNMVLRVWDIALK